MMNMEIHWLSILPIIIVLLTGLGLTFLRTPALLGGLSLTGLTLAGMVAGVDLVQTPAGFKRVLFHGVVTFDAYSHFFSLLLIGCAILTMVAAWAYFPREKMAQSEVYSLLMLSLGGMMILPAATHLIAVFIAIEIMSIAIYALVGARRMDVKGNESALKYFLLGSFGSAILLYGIALTYGAAGSVQFDALREFAANPDPARLPLLLAGIAMLVVGFGFKVAAAPFHAWTPDVYEGAPAPITGFMSTAVKAASFAFILRTMAVAFLPVKGEWVEVIAGLAVVTMFTGNILAFVQGNIKRMLAYSSIAHTGYMLMGLTALSSQEGAFGGASILYYLVAYCLTNLALFAAIGFVSRQGEKLVEIDDFSGLGAKFPGLSLVVAICMASLIGIPPTAGFFAKYFLFSSVIEQGFAWLAVIGIINSILSVYYYLRVVVVMYFKEPRADWSDATGLVPVRIVGVFCAVMIVWAGVGATSLLYLIPGAAPLMAMAKTSFASLF